MQTAAGSIRKQKLIAAGAIIALAILSTQAYAYIASGSLTTGGIPKAGGSTDPQTNSTISVTGNGQVNIQPTIAILSIGVDTQNPSAQTAAQQNANVMTNIISALGALGINSSSIQTVSYNIYQQYPYPVAYAGAGPSINSTAISASYYEVDNQIQVTISVTSQNLAQLGTKVGAAIDAAVAQGANEIYGVQFTASDSAMQLANQQALAAAVQDASGQAKAIASALDVTITGVVSVTTSPLYSPSPIISTPAAQVSSQTPVVAPQSLTVSASVQAVYAIS